MSGLNVKISKGNSKMGEVMSVSLPPILSCGKALPCFKGCYADKLSRLRPVVKAAWANNWKMVMTDRDRYMAQIHVVIAVGKPPLFRWHVAGDIPDFAYLADLRLIATWTPDTNHLVFTKKYDLVRLLSEKHMDLPENLSIVLSMWPGLEIPGGLTRRYPKAWMRDKRNPDNRIPEDAKECDGGCETCGLCWKMKDGESVVFTKH